MIVAQTSANSIERDNPLVLTVYIFSVYADGKPFSGINASWTAVHLSRGKDYCKD